jgi:hypothetical protein
MRFAVAAVLLVSSLLLVWGVSGALVGSSQGYVIYKMTLNSQGAQPEVFSVNETVEPSSQAGLVQMTVTVLSSLRNMTYSTTVNSSSTPELFPYLVGLNNESFSYQTSGIDATVHIHYTGSAQVSFDNISYQGTKYQLSLSAQYTPLATQIAGNGTALTLPSGLIYSVQVENTNSTLDAQLVNTNLPLNVATGSSLPVGLALLSIGLLAAIAFAVPSVFIHWKRKPKVEPEPSSQPQTGDKPSYWVD